MNNLRFRAVLFIALAIGVICMAIVATTFVPVDIYPHGERLRDYALFVQGVVTTVAIGAGAYVADRRFQIFRTFQPHLTITHRITHRQLSESYIHIEVTAVLHNRSRVKTDLRRGFVSLMGVAPVSDEEAEFLYTRSEEGRNYRAIQWPELDYLECIWDAGELVVEPGESHSETFEFIVEETDYTSILAYTYFYNTEDEDGDESAGGWAATTVYDILDARLESTERQ